MTDEHTDPEVFNCPECGNDFETKQKLGVHRRNEHGVASTRNDKKDGAPRREPKADSARQAQRRTLVKETILELVDTTDELRGRSTEAILDLADVIRRDADKMASALAALAERGPFVLLGVVIDKLLGAGGPFSLLRAFAPTARQMLARARDSRVENAAVQAQFDAEVEQMMADGLDQETATIAVQERWNASAV